MSSFLCNEKHFNSISYNLLKFVKQNKINLYRLESLGYYEQSENVLKNKFNVLANMLLNINLECVSRQYAHHYNNDPKNAYDNYKEELIGDKEYKELTLLGLYNALCCLDYQIEWDRLPNSSKVWYMDFYNAFQLLTDAVAHAIVNELPADKSNNWHVK